MQAPDPQVPIPNERVQDPSALAYISQAQDAANDAVNDAENQIENSNPMEEGDEDFSDETRCEV